MQTIEIGALLSPWNDYDLNMLSERTHRIVMSFPGSIGGDKIIYYGWIKNDDPEAERNPSALVIELPVSNRKLILNRNFIVSMEQCRLYKYTLNHSNDNYPTPCIKYYAFPMSIELQTVNNRQTFDRDIGLPKYEAYEDQL